MTPEQIADLITNLGVIGVLILGIWAFLTGKVVSAKSHEEALEIERKASERAAEIISKELGEAFKNGISDGIAQGIAKGYLQVREQRSADS